VPSAAERTPVKGADPAARRVEELDEHSRRFGEDDLERGAILDGMRRQGARDERRAGPMSDAANPWGKGGRMVVSTKQRI